jgi:putative hydrolase of the HAD superfamily
VIEWLLVDYGEVISLPLPDDTSNELATLAGQNPAEFLRRYWQARPAYDLGQTPATYWSQVLGRDLTNQTPSADQLTRVDVPPRRRAGAGTRVIVAGLSVTVSALDQAAAG